MSRLSTLGIVSSPGSLFDVDLHALPRELRAAREGQGEVQVIVERHAFALATDEALGDERAVRECRMLLACQALAERGAGAILLADADTEPSLDALHAELGMPVATMMSVLRDHLAARMRAGDLLVVAARPRVRASGVFERHLPEGVALRHLPMISSEEITEWWAALQETHLPQRRVVLLSLVPPSMSAALLGAAPVDAVSLDLPAIWADWSHRALSGHAPPPFKLGIVGGIGPAATVDFMDKVLRNTEAHRDQDHIKMLVEHNPQIPDRTAHLVDHAQDPTLALFAACARLQAGGVSAIALPCNTAHAFIGRIQPYLGIPIVDMLRETVGHIVARFGPGCRVGLLATSGTLASRVYHNAAADYIDMLTPAPAVQEQVMAAIYGPSGVKAGFTTGECRDRIETAIAHLAGRGAEVVILGCTELPLLIEETDAYPVDGRSVTIVDPTNVLARRCVQLARPLSQSTVRELTP
ncbi:aspartate/glutamate racemase family protein [Burkholderia gladioli]|uniref:aspartate/glutamate racemase family protein n=1 Tax=Burkholderia gladioli TaxID=28095 RepID=UPI00163ED797|nr:amino acid racemase [Burkholderia gladioli]